MLNKQEIHNPIHILYVDDYPLDRELVRDALEREKFPIEFRVTEAASRQEFLVLLALESFQYDVVLSDFNILGFEGLQVIEAVQIKAPKVPVIIVTGTGSEEVAVKAMKQGAADYVIKNPKHIRRLPATIVAVLEKMQLKEEQEEAQIALQKYVVELERAQAAEREQRELAEALRDVGLALSATLEFDTLLDCLLSQIGRVVPYDAAKIMLIEADKIELARQHGYEELGLEVASEFFFLTNSSYLGDMMQSQQPLIIPNIHQQEQVSKSYFGSWAGAPIIVSDVAIAYFSLYKIETDFYQPKHATALAAFAGQAAIAFQNARLFEHAQQEIRERKRAETALEKERASLAQRVSERTYELSAANAKLERAARLKDEFLASMSHELRTPLSTILGLAEILLEELHGSLNKEQHDFVQNIEHSGRHLLELINDILDVAKIEAGQIELEFMPVMVERLCEASLRLIKPGALKKRLRLSFSFDNAIKDILADERRLKQILINLLSNAVKFTPEGGLIGLEVIGDEEAKVIHFKVWDTGIGIAEENFRRLFNPFTQLDSRLSREYNGTGLGLTLVHRLTEMHNGGIEVKSKLGQGSCFTVSLPWYRATKSDFLNRWEIQKKKLQSKIVPEQSHFRILLAEDNEAMQDTICNYLQHKQYTVIVARNGKEAIARTEEEKPDLILMDIQMPVCNGLEAIRHIRTNEAFRSIPIIALTALAMPGDRTRCLEAGANDYLVKPVRLKTLVTTIEQHLTKGEENHGSL